MNRGEPVRPSFKTHHAAGRAAGSRARVRRAGPVTTTQVDRAVRELALIFADGNAARLRIISPTEVIVENKPRGGK